MSSIRSLVTITVLAGVGIFLYLKINETPPVVPAEVGDFSLDAIQFGELSGQLGEQPSTPSAAPAFSPSVAAAPTSQQAPTGKHSHAHTTPNTLTPPPLTTPTSEAPAFGASPEASVSVASVPDLPPLPTVPPTHHEETPPAALPVEVAPHEHSTETTQNHSAPPAFKEPASHTHSESSSTPVTPTIDATSQGKSSLYSVTRLSAEAALDRGELSQALLLLSDWYDDPSLTPTESQEINQLLRQLAGTVIYSTEHRLEPPYMVQAGEQLEDIAQKYQVPWQLLAKINGISPANQLQPGQKLKVVRGPFSALIDLGRRKMTLMLDRRYAGQFSLDVNPGSTVEEGHWAVNQKLLTPGNVGSFGLASEDRSLMLSSPDGSASQLVIIRGSSASTPVAADPAGRVLRLKPHEVGEIYDILSLGSRVVIRK